MRHHTHERSMWRQLFKTLFYNAYKRSRFNDVVLQDRWAIPETCRCLFAQNADTTGDSRSSRDDLWRCRHPLASRPSSDGQEEEEEDNDEEFLSAAARNQASVSARWRRVWTRRFIYPCCWRAPSRLVSIACTTPRAIVQLKCENMAAWAEHSVAWCSEL